jgi:uncharacterized protein YegP (UPF0339 family)
MKRKPRFTVLQGSYSADGRWNSKLWYWNLRGSNGEIVAQSEGYSTRSSAIRATRRLLKIVSEAEMA